MSFQKIKSSLTPTLLYLNETLLFCRSSLVFIESTFRNYPELAMRRWQHIEFRAIPLTPGHVNEHFTLVSCSDFEEKDASAAGSAILPG